MKQVLYMFFSGWLLCSNSGCNTAKHNNGAYGSDDNFRNKRWVLERFHDISFDRPEKDIYVLFDENSEMVNGFGGCNGFRGHYTAQGNRLKVSQIAATKMWCNNDWIENRFLRVLDSASNYYLSGDSLQLAAGDNVLAYFYAVYLR